MSVIARLIGRLPAIAGFDAAVLVCLLAMTGTALALR